MTRSLAEAAAEAATCPRCRLAESRTQVVFGVGDPDADLLFIGEAPGLHEDRQGEPFVGAAGQLLTRMLGDIGLRREDVYIANVLKCRPPENRPPQPDEVAACRPYLKEQAVGLVQADGLVIIDPKGHVRAVSQVPPAEMKLIDYLPCYRSEAGTGIGTAFAVWQ